MINEKNKKIIKIISQILAIITIIVFSYAITPKTFQNDTFYTIKIGEHISNTTKSITDLLPWNKGLDMQDQFSFHNLPYTYPHWLYDFITYKIYDIGNFQGLYYATCILSIILGLSIYFVNIKLNKNHVISFVITIGSLFCLKDFIAARAQLVTFILFVFTIYCIEQFIKNKKIRYAVFLVIIPIIIANVHTAVWPFYFILYLPYIVEYFIILLTTTDYELAIKKISLFFKSKFMKDKIDNTKINIEKSKIKKLEEMHDNKMKNVFSDTYKFNIKKEKNSKWLILILFICLFTGLLTPIKETPYTYLVKTNQGNTTQNISEHLPLTLINDEKMVVILTMLVGILIFSKVKIKIRDFLMLAGLIFLSFMTRRQVSMFVLIGNFILVRLIVCVLKNITKQFEKIIDDKKLYVYAESITIIMIFITSILSFDYIFDKKDNQYVDHTFYPIEAVEYINTQLIPEVGIQNLRMYNDYNYGSYLLFSNIPVFIDSRADLYAPEFNGKKDENGNYIGNDIFTDFINISSLAADYESKFEEYNITHVMTYENSKLSSVICKDENYNLIYEDEYFKIYERQTENVL